MIEYLLDYETQSVRRIAVKNIYLIGFMGTGKSSIASSLGKNYNMEVVEMDEAIEKKEGMTISEIFSRKGEEYFRQVESQLIMEIGAKNNQVVSCGGGTPMRQENVDEMKKSGTIVLLTATPQTVFERVRHSNNRPLLNSNMNVEYISKLMEQRREKYEAAADIVIDTNDKTKDTIVNEIIHIFAK